MEEYSNIVLLLILVGLSAVFSASETALTAFRKIKLKEVEKQSPRSAELLKVWLKKPNQILTAMLLGNNVVNILASVLATLLVDRVLVNKYNYSEETAAAVVTSVLTVVILIFGEITPKIIAKKYSENFSKILIIPIYYMSIVVYPITLILTLLSRIIGRFFGVELTHENLLITEDDIKSMVNVGKDEGVIEEEEKDMIHSIFEFGDSTAKEVMVPRIGIFAIEASKNVDEIWDKVIDAGYSRIPVYEGRIDNIIGILYLKDLLPVIKKGNVDLPLKNFIREAYFVPETKLLIELLQEFREKKIHIAVVLDEYGGTQGILTIEDLLEEIVGEINDEYDHEEEKIKEIDNNIFKVNPMIDIPSLNKELSLFIPEEEEYDTLGGFISFTLGKIPEKGDKIESYNIKIEVKGIENHRITDVILEKIGEDKNE